LKCSSWWFAGKGIPLIAATLGPLANLTSLCAIICTWEQIGLDTNMGRAVGIKDPAWFVILLTVHTIFSHVVRLTIGIGRLEPMQALWF